MRLFTRVLIVLGLLVVVLAGAFKLGGPDLLVKYPASVDKTFAQTGDTTLYVAPQSVTPVAKPLTVPLTVQVRMHTIGHAGNDIVVAEEQQQNLNKGAIKADQKLTFVFDRSTMKNVANVRAFAFDPNRGLDRSRTTPSTFRSTPAAGRTRSGRTKRAPRSPWNRSARPPTTGSG